MYFRQAACPAAPRIHLDNATLHIVQRRHSCQFCFFGEQDYVAYPH
jgi:hypothetical protein